MTMQDSDHKDYSLTQLEEWVSDCMDSGATPHEIYGTIVDTVYKNVRYHKSCLHEGQELYNMLLGSDVLPEDYDDFENPNPRQDNVIRIEEFRNDGSDRSRTEFAKFWEESDFELTSDALLNPESDKKEKKDEKKESFSVDDIGC